MKAKRENISIINRDCILEGNFDFKGYLIVAGSLDGKLNADTVITEEDSRIIAKVNVNSITIAGFFEGEIKVTETLTILGTGNVKAQIKCSKLAIEEGGILNGNVTFM
ncbi:MAG: polymer-forming cytoskeletal protein [Proteobacteria bacterium]|nr:polymer-forming cytoskeletal protein [Pseudomonadota bacterium]